MKIWHPYTQEATEPAPLEIVRGEGAYLYTRDGRRLLDAISSWWVNLHGHGHPLIAEAVAAIALEGTVDDLINTIHAHPTLAEATHEAMENVFGAAIHI